MDFGHRLKCYRKAFKWTQTTLSAESGIRQSRISKLENNGCFANIKELSAIAGAFYITESEFLDNNILLALKNRRKKEATNHGSQEANPEDRTVLG